MLSTMVFPLNEQNHLYSFPCYSYDVAMSYINDLRVNCIYLYQIHTVILGRFFVCLLVCFVLWLQGATIFKLLNFCSNVQKNFALNVTWSDLFLYLYYIWLLRGFKVATLILYCTIRSHFHFPSFSDVLIQYLTSLLLPIVLKGDYNTARTGINIWYWCCFNYLNSVALAASRSSRNLLKVQNLRPHTS